MFEEDEAKDWMERVVEFEGEIRGGEKDVAALALDFAADLREAMYRDAEAGGWYCDLEKIEDEARELSA